MLRKAVVVVLLLAAVAQYQQCEAHLSLSVSNKDGSFVITHDGQPWLSGGEVVVDGMSSATGELVMLQQKGEPAAGKDQFGAHEATTFTWASARNRTTPLIVTSFRTYPDDAGKIVFAQYFPNAVGRSRVSGAGSNPTGARSSFPTFRRSKKLMSFSYHGVFPRMVSSPFMSYVETFQGGSPLTMYRADNESLPMTTFSPLTTPKAHHMTTTNTSVGAGVKSTAEIIPAGFQQLFMLSAGVGINAGMIEWGNRVLAWTGKPRADMHAEGVISTIGFWTDNGGFYHYSIGDNKSLGTNYETVLPNVKAYHDELGVPFKHWQFDSWFYPKDGGVNPGGGGGAVTNWTSLQSVFPHGMSYIQQKLGVPMVMHNRQWSTKSDYIKNLPFEWYISEKAAIPHDPEAFFTWFFKQQDGWGLAMYEQDWMCTEYEEVEALQSNLTLADMWLEGMAAGAASSGRTIQYCMPYPHDVLAAAALPAVTNVRATGDYFHSDNNWAIGATSLMYYAIGVLPFKDGFYSSSAKQVGGQTEGPETDPDREALMATLSCAMVGPMDGYGMLNVSRVMSTCRGDGVILKPDRPLTTVDWCFLEPRTADNCYVYSTHTDVLGVGRITYVFMNDASAPLVPSMAGISQDDMHERGYAVVNWYTGETKALTNTNDVSPGYEGHVFVRVVPVVQGWVFLGEVDKYVTSSGVRFHNVTATPESMSARLVGAAGEVVRVCAAQVGAMSKEQWQCRRVTFAGEGEDLSVTAVEFR